MTLQGYITAEVTYSTVHAHHKVFAWSCATLVMHSLGHAHIHVQYACKSSTVKALATATSCLHWGSIMIMLCAVILWLLHAISWLLLWLLCGPGERLCLWPLCQPGENKCICTSHRSLSLPASQLELCLPWVQQTVQTFWTTRQLTSWKGSAICFFTNQCRKLLLRTQLACHSVILVRDFGFGKQSKPEGLIHLDYKTLFLTQS